MNENCLSPLPQYHIDRDKLCEIVKETIVADGFFYNLAF